MASDFSIQIVNQRTGQIVVGFEPGSRVETDLVDELITRTRGEGIGVFKTSASVEAAIRKSWSELLYSLKSQVRPLRP